MSERLIAPNVSTVPIYSPLRYPGGKSRLYPFIVKWLERYDAKEKVLVEPFAGAAHVSIAGAIEHLVQKVILVDLDDDIAAIWQTILGDECDWLIEKVKTFVLTKDNVNEIFSKSLPSRKEQAFGALLRNRLSRGGILAPGAGTLENGEDGKGIQSRWYPSTICQRLQTIHSVRNRIQFIQGDGLDLMRRHCGNQDVLFFVDPPYTVAGRRLYTHYNVKPHDVIEAATGTESDFLVTYDHTEQILDLVKTHSLTSRTLTMHTAHHRQKDELIISRNLDWLD